ncbi:MAG: UDP-N-acetylglucosamine pyrophosphorylase [Oscillospiraceae bacterium]|nr:UDP-N-acetylglucosamine pyrophosphorylase [Oscillospiraceae bacterium]
MNDTDTRGAVSLDNMRVTALFEPDRTITWKYLAALNWPWEALALISDYISQIGQSLPGGEYNQMPGNVWIHKTATVAPSAFLGEHVIIGEDTEVRHGAFIRGSAIVGKKCVVGNSTELKNVILFDNVQVPHFNYIGDSIFGYKAHAGAGVVTCNVKNDRSLVRVFCGERGIDTGLKKFGAIVGDNVDVGCNCALNPGTVIGPRTSIYPLSLVRGYIKSDSIYKKQGEIVERL